MPRLYHKTLATTDRLSTVELRLDDAKLNIAARLQLDEETFQRLLVGAACDRWSDWGSHEAANPNTVTPTH